MALRVKRRRSDKELLDAIGRRAIHVYRFQESTGNTGTWRWCAAIMEPDEEAIADSPRAALNALLNKIEVKK